MSTPAVRAAYDAVARAYEAAIGDELAAKPLDRALLRAVGELAGAGTLGDLGCGPGHVTRHLAAHHPDVVGVDLSPAMVEVARAADPGGTYLVASMLDLPVADDAWVGAVAAYSVIHLEPEDRRRAWAELARVLRPGGVLLVSFHVRTAEVATGGSSHLSSWFGHDVDLRAYFLDPEELSRELVATGFAPSARLDRSPAAEGEFPSERCSLVVRRT